MRVPHALGRAQEMGSEIDRVVNGDADQTLVASLTCEGAHCSVGMVLLSLFTNRIGLRNRLPIACPGCGDDMLVNYIAPADMAPGCDRRALWLPVPA